MKISQLIKELAEAQMERGDIPVMMEFLSIPEDELAVVKEDQETHYEEIDFCCVTQIGFRFFAQLSVE